MTKPLEHLDERRDHERCGEGVPESERVVVLKHWAENNLHKAA